ncbi:DUF3290 family protein [Streptococcus sp. zg-JUN1979]|uniref:DUF3290 family protein n=1 Tax=Streptococcus sp. zg-JUN1979 TaxID=3391450 RepID=UPI0039A56CB8
MAFYSYDYVLSQISQSNWLLMGLLSALLVGIITVSIKAYRNQKDSKYRELVIILVLSLIATLLITISGFQANQASDNQYRTSLHFIEMVSSQLEVDKSEVYVNTSAATDGAIVYVDGQFYRAIEGSSQDSYLLEKIEMYRSDVELVEVGS